MSDTEKDQGPKSTFTTYMAEGDQLYHKGEYLKATESYTTALTLQPNDKNCLVARSKCYVKMGDSENALQDAEASLKDDKEFFKGLYQKAEALYALGDFEFALVFYHRGNRLRPGLQQFRLGIQKAQEAIDNSVGSPSSVKLENKGDLSVFHKPVEGKKGKLKGSILPSKKAQQLSQKDPKSGKISRQLLGELHSDKEYLEKLLKDEDLVKDRMRNGEKLQDLIVGCLTYLDTRTEFWRQQKPIYARERDRKLMRQKWTRTQVCSASNTASYVLKSLEEIDAALSSGNAKGSLKKAREVLKTVQNWSEGTVPNKVEVLGNLHSCIGNALFDMGEMKRALDSHQKDLELARDGNLTDAKSRALDNIGRVYARIGKFPQAIQVWEEKIPLAYSALERAWLFHEIGRCYLELKRYTEARDYGSRSLAAADDIGDQKWRLNASVLVAQSEGELGNYKSSVAHFEEALLQASVLQDEPARDAIQKALCKARQHVTELEMKPLT
ncbi:outer dynein arm-docking complex subunit 4 isoform X1 [Brienomyrus brachyistius]|uniref:outer dynein arm-docking complex subunit 4 isoform X1 n=2 Tax=Brienomyrus brachyistius TaxID=42636 RepID=UPI0020B20F80|nr:outer dynein arm-docking complex subunit 4 isoform X1 [Brienomyrus brachyistius]